MIDVENLRVRRGGREVLSLQGWRLATGEAALLTGPSGAGKSTLLNAIAGLLSPTQGRVCVDGADLASMNEATRDRFRAEHIGIVFQSARFIRAMTVEENLALALRLARKPDDLEHILSTLARLGVADMGKRRPHTLSVGEAQRVAIARAVIAQPKLILADEPTSALDDANAGGAMDILFTEARACGATLLVASHDARLHSRFQTRLDLAAS